MGKRLRTVFVNKTEQTITLKEGMNEYQWVAKLAPMSADEKSEAVITMPTKLSTDTNYAFFLDGVKLAEVVESQWRNFRRFEIDWKEGTGYVCNPLKQRSA